MEIRRREMLPNGSFVGEKKSIYITLKISSDCKLTTSQKSDSTNIITKAIVEVQQHK